MHMWKKLLSCCLCLMLVLSSFAPLAGAEGGIATSTDTCDHQNTETIRREANPRDYVDAYFAYHEYTADIYITVVCNDCDAVVTPETLSGSETCRSAHEYVDGVCVCGRKECKHENLEVEEVLQFGSGCTTVDNDYHVYEVACIGIRDYCPDCGYWVFNEVDRENVKEKHAFDENGKCYECGYVKCQHANLTYTNERAEKTGVVSALDGLVHIVYENVYATPVCSDCGEVLDEVFRYEGSPEEKHTFVDGVCSECGFLECQHTNAYTEEVCQEWDACNSADDTYHAFINGNWYYRTYCPDCRTVIYTDEKMIDSKLAKHSVDEDGVCWDCGYVSTCKHTNTVREEERWENDGYTAVPTPVDDKTHQISGYHHWIDVCADCGVIIKRNEVYDDTATFNHTFVDGVCKECGYECLHTATSKKENKQELLTWADGAQHAIRYLDTEETWCDTCGVKV